MQFVIPTFGEDLAITMMHYQVWLITANSDNPAVYHEHQLCAACSGSPHDDESSD